MLWAGFYWFKNGISYTTNLAAFRVPVSEFRNSGESESGGTFSDRPARRAYRPASGS